jgi:putative membrane protein
MESSYNALLTHITVGISNALLTVLGFVIGLALSFRTSTAYERYSDGRKAWTVLSVQCRNLARYIWIHTVEREGEEGKDDLLAKITAMNMILAFTVSLKHKLRFEPYAYYPDIASLVGHLDTYAKAAHTAENEAKPRKSIWKRAGEHLGVDFAVSNPRKAIKRAKMSNTPLGNLPLEILSYLGSYLEEITKNGTMASPVVAGQMRKFLHLIIPQLSNS